MAAEDRWSIEELDTRYDLEPTIADVFVEGKFDQEVLRRCFDDLGQRDRVAYPIEVVDVPLEVLEAQGLTPGRKQEVIALARRLGRLPDPRAYRCLVDRDLDHWFGPLESTPRLVWTKYTSLDFYLYSERFLKDVLLVAAKCQIPNWAKFQESLESALVSLYCMRLVDRELGLKMTWLTFDRCLKVHKGLVVLDQGEYIKRVLAENRKTAQREEFDTALDRWKAQVTADRRLWMRGHDLVDLLAWVVLKFGGLKPFQDSEAIERLIVVMTDKSCGIGADLSVV